MNTKPSTILSTPIKVNQMRQVVEEIVSSGKRFHIGLEAGSKPELHAVLAINTEATPLLSVTAIKMKVI